MSLKTAPVGSFTPESIEISAQWLMRRAHRHLRAGRDKDALRDKTLADRLFINAYWLRKERLNG